MPSSSTGAIFGSSSSSAAFELPGPARSAPRLELLLNLITPSLDAQQADEILAIISQSGLLAQVPQDETRHKLTVRINSLISSQNALGYRLAHLWIQQDPSVWNDHLISNASTWATQIINLLSAPDKLLLQREQSDRLLAAALQFAVTHLFPENIASRQEFYRQVVHPHLPKVVFGLAQLLESILLKQESEGITAFGSHLHTVLIFIDRLLHAHAAQFRPVSSRVHECITSLLYSDDALLIPQPIFTSAATVLSSLHLTGALASKGSEASGGSARTTQSQLWAATLEIQLQLASEAWTHATSSYEVTTSPPTGTEGRGSSAYKHLAAYAKDPLAATKLAHTRLALLLGSRGRSGLINSHLRSPTTRPVPIAAGKLIALVLDMLRIDLNSRFKPTAEAKVCSLQASHLSTLHTRALALIAQLAITAPAAVSLQASRVLGDICRIAETGVASSSALAGARLKLAAMRTLAVLVGRRGVTLPLDPAGRTALRLARLAVTQVARSVLQPIPTSSSASAGDARKAKKARLYESDSMFASQLSAKDQIHTLSVEEIASTQAALEILVAVYPLLTTNLSAVHYDQMQLSVQTILALVEVLSDSLSTHSAMLRHQSAGSGALTSTTLLRAAIEALADLCLDSPSSTLALVLPRAIPVLDRIAHAPGGAGDARIRTVAERALMQVHASRRGKFVPVARGVGFGPRAGGDMEPAPDGSKLTSDVRAIPVGEALESGLQNITTAILGKPVPIQVEGEERMDVDAITAESAELFNATGSDAATPIQPAPSATGVGLGLPTSPRRAATENRIFSPDPVKPTHRPSTPRIGSPNAHPQGRSRPASPSLDVSGAGGGAPFLTPGRISTPVGAGITEAAVHAAAQVVETPDVTEVVQEIVDATTAEGDGGREEVRETLFRGSDEDEDDEDMPEIDMGESDEEEEEGA
ncbi:hypothetical protein PSEUBRA_000342 [Kalmanozyma brasiliensis GHG001]|uniref:Pre-rRNA-processing protein RIX1 N-terminal domain-containing protein n=1 Tax=Kalmanozyma brasiliensis (strain GHG001) TaxID=1365824 RepID=V5F0U0_KALBG|nr:uncharacterized protein PSEUBRA_000342 [Kalmanozyma brasiliensis GHG001]EST09943.1 hypothetical protein PSEUBRA_000342 [Kalmanozyma brasiliensis GHG001]